jgi:hypothetical protein
MAKRFTDTEIWIKQRWFKKLDPLDKLIFIYLKDNCNHAGIWKIDVIQLIEDIGLDECDIKAFIDRVNIDYDPLTA